MVDLSDAQWDYVRLFVEWQQKSRMDGRGGLWSDARQVLNGVLWILRTGAPWKDLPVRYGSYQTCHLRFQQWQRTGVLEGLLWALCEELLARGQIDLREPLLMPPYAGTKKGHCGWSNTPRQRDQDHGNCSAPWSSCRRRDCKRFAT
jgi:transposase